MAVNVPLFPPRVFVSVCVAVTNWCNNCSMVIHCYIVFIYRLQLYSINSNLERFFFAFTLNALILIFFFFIFIQKMNVSMLFSFTPATKCDLRKRNETVNIRFVFRILMSSIIVSQRFDNVLECILKLVNEHLLWKCAGSKKKTNKKQKNEFNLFVITSNQISCSN